MRDLQKKKEVKTSVNPILAGIAGVVAGGMAVAAAVAMSDKNNQKKVKKAFGEAKDKISGYMDKVKSQPVVQQGTKKLDDAVGTVKKAIADKV